MFDNNPNIIKVSWRLFVKDEASFQPLLATLTGHGYVVTDESTDNPRYPKPGTWSASCRGKTPPKGWWEHCRVVQMWDKPRYEPSPRLHETIITTVAMTADCGYYINDGRTMFHPNMLEEMRDFVEHFTTLDLQKWDDMIAGAPKTGPGMVQAVAAFCHPQAIVENKPNFGNVMNVLGKMVEGMSSTVGELSAATHSLADPDIRREFDEITNALGITRGQ